MKKHYIKLLLLIFWLSGCSVQTVNLGFKHTTDEIEYPILVQLMNNSEQTLFSKVVNFNGQDIPNGKGELFRILPGSHELKVKWLAILNSGNTFFLTGTLPANSFLNSTKTYYVKANFEKGYTYMLDQGQLHTKDKYLPSKLCLFKRPTFKDETIAYKNRIISNNMELVDCYSYEGNHKKDYRISGSPW